MQSQIDGVTTLEDAPIANENNDKPHSYAASKTVLT